MACYLRFVTVPAVLIALVLCVPVQAQTPEIDALRARAEQGDADAIAWFLREAEQGNAAAQSQLGRMYYMGTVVARDYAEALRWTQRAVEQGDAVGQNTMGVMYTTGGGVSQNYAEGVRWFRRAAEQGHSRAQYNLGVSYAEGQGVPQDAAEAVRWHRRAAEHGYANSQSFLGYAYSTGQGVPLDNLQAYAWYNLAASVFTGADRDDTIEQRDRIGRQLNRADISEAQRLSREWAAANFSPNADAPDRGTDPGRTAPLAQGSETAFVVHPDGLLLTAHHVIDQATAITVSCNGRPAVPAIVRSSSATIDLALLEADGVGAASYLRLSPQSVPSLGDDVFTIGYPTPDLLGTDPKYTNGTVSALSGLRGDASFLQISVPIQPGNSGGPLVNEDGDVIGVVVSTASAPAFIRAIDSIPQNINWSVKSAFANVLFEPPSADVRPLNERDTVINRVTEATCLVRVTGPVQ